MRFTFKSLTVRIVGAAALILALAGAAVGWALYANIKHSVQEEVKTQLHQRLAWLHSSLELDDTGRLELESRLPRANLPQNWRVTTLDGKLLWAGAGAEAWNADDPGYILQTRSIQVGDSAGQNLPPGALHPSGKSSDSNFDIYLSGVKNSRMELRLWARESIAHNEKELHRVALALWTIGPASLAALVAVLALFIRAQHAPLTRMSLEAAAIGPDNAERRIGPAGSSIELVRLREALNSMLGRLAEGMQRERQFSSMAAHELRTPLTQLRMNAEIALSKERGAADYKEALTQSLIDLERLQQLVANLLFLTRSTQGPGMRQKVRLEAVIKHAARSCGAAERMNFQGGDVTVRGNEELLQCAVRNVLENALRYAPGTSLEVTVIEGEKSTELRVADGGPGIPAADRERIFEPLTRLDEARTIGVEPGGFGLGLTVARNAMRACGGKLVCQARADGKPGAVFVFTFIRADRPNAASA